MTSHLRIALLVLLLGLASSTRDGAVDVEACAADEDEIAVGLLQVNTRKAKARPVADADTGASWLHSPTDTEWDTARAELVQLQGIADSRASAVTGPCGSGCLVPQGGTCPAGCQGGELTGSSSGTLYTVCRSGALVIKTGETPMCADALIQLQNQRGGGQTVTGSGNVSAAARADLVPMLEMLQGLYNSSKQQISQLTSRETKSKQHFEERQNEHEARLLKINARFKNSTLSDEFHAEELREENKMFSYWQRVREHEQKQFRSFLSIKHTMMHKMKRMIDLYEEVIGGTADATKIQETIDQVSGRSGPLVFLQEQGLREDERTLIQEVAKFCQDALHDVRASRSHTLP